jgi:hypothetical protein
MYTMRAKNTGQVTNISADVDSNVVQYYTENGGQKVWIINDFDTVSCGRIVYYLLY